MDIAIPFHRERRFRRRVLIVLGGGVLAAAGVWGVAHLRPADPIVDQTTIWTDVVKRGPLLREVRGTGSLVPEEIRWIPAQVEGRVDRILLHPGAVVRPETVILEIQNPELERDVQNSAVQLKGAQADWTDLKAQLNSTLGQQKADVASTRADYEQAKLQANVDEQFRKEGLGSELKASLSKGRMEQLAIQLQMKDDTVKRTIEWIGARLQAAESKVELQRLAYEQKLARREAQLVRAGVAGVLQQIPVEVGQQLAAGTNVARVADPARLQAQLLIADTLIRDVVQGQRVSLDTHTAVIPGRVSRIAPAVVNGTIAVDVAIEGPLPPDARPDLSIDGSIEIARLKNTLSVGRPSHTPEGGNFRLFRLSSDGKLAERQNVRLGISSADRVEILGGLNEGDRIVLSDTSAFDGYDRIRIKQ